MTTLAEERVVSSPPAVLETPSVPWAAVIAGAIVAAGISLVLLAFGSGVGLSVMSSAPTWRNTSAIYWIVTGLYLVFTALASYGFGGYVAGRLRPRFAASRVEELEYRDGLHGLLTWALATVLAAFIAAAAVATASLTAASALPHKTATTDASSGETLLASELDRLFRTDRNLSNTDYDTRRTEASRILMTSGGHNGVSNEDRDYLTTMVGGITGTRGDEATARVNRAIAESHDAIVKSRTAAVLEAFMIAAALLLGAAVAWAAAQEGGRERDTDTLPRWQWALQSRRPHSAVRPI